MKDIMDNVINSFNGGNSGYSSKKLTAFVIVCCVIAAHVKWITLGNFTQLEMVLTIDFTFIAACFGMTTYQSIKESPKTTTATLEKQVDGENTKTTITNEQA